MGVSVVTDSTACLSAETLDGLRIAVVPLRVTMGSRTTIDGVDVSSAEVARALRSKVGVSTSRPAPAEFAAKYQELLDAGASNVVSVHLSAALSGTWESAVLAAQDFPHGVVRVVDSRSTAMGLGFAVIAAARRAAEGGSAAEVQGAATAAVDGTSTLFYVDTLEYLRRGGRIGTAAALFGTTLSVKPLLQLVEGQIVGLEKVRTSAKALARLVELTVRAAGSRPVDLAVHHVAALERATAVEAQLRDQLPKLGDSQISELGPVIGAHLGPGVVGTVISRR
ncbi:MAG: fatty acid kinase fatty acid binding subunit [Pseudonocardiales bacterium]|jgi:DegV family protein with EDD domain|nr:fatty acid kinase fatty acid binding subunit [Pseudonocardiales bacterium]